MRRISKFAKVAGLILPIVAAAWLAAAPQARADLMTDLTINFNVSSGSPTPTGSIVYDDTTQTFKSFVITWDTENFNFTSDFPGFALSTVTGLFNEWSAIDSSTLSIFDLGNSSIGPDLAAASISELIPGTTATSANGTLTFTPTAAAVPEPSALAILGTALAAFCLFGSWANGRGRRTPPAPT